MERNENLKKDLHQSNVDCSDAGLCIILFSSFFLFNHYCCPAMLVLNGAILYATQSFVKLG